jgi:hypothetical protein
MLFDLVALSLVVGCYCNEVNHTMSWIERLQSPNVDERRMAFEDFSAQRSQLIGALLQIVNHWGETRESDVIEVHSAEHLAILALGVLRASEAAPIIIKYIKVRDTGFHPNASDEKVPLDAHFSALRALIQIGKSSIRSLREAIAMAQDDLTIQLAVVGIIRIEGRELAQFHLKALRKDVIDEVIHGSEANIEKALSFVEDPTIVSELKLQE